MTQATLWNSAGDIVVDTRVASLHSVARLRPNQQRQILEFLIAREAFGATDGEIAEATGLDGNTVRPRRGELRDGGQVVNSGRTRRTESGRKSAVWIATGKPLD